ncbi:RagB/SusD family nutrient uptake outer membrane protein [Parabacteroides hominis]|uniref:RagB/SusD family nutrient uptake outer membrane protein n=1 Tax=Parabacteroides hominis TaxID=2763057 RepID=A0ABR7DN01_9BACT|nr:RagB/SusD family nutrient uptake outer membrane protein [Parabacteroides hominis]MBC5632801.1 RagB/SusD family nutrient uptake outer membrane protein [Parabacteroides hominis]
MKKFLINLILVLPILMSSCADFLDRYPTDSLSPATFWQTEDDAYLAMVGCYNKLEPIYGGYNMMYWDTASDNLFNYFSWEGYKLLANGNAQTSDVGVNFFTFLDIRACNEYLENEANVEWASTETQNQYKAEVRAIRAMIYFWKTEQYGDFPFFTNVLETPEEALLSRTDVGTIREFIVAELEDCIQYLPDKSGTEQGRINKQAVQAVLMRYYLYRGDYANALSYAKEIKESGQFSMPASLSYADVFLLANQYNSETILSHSYLESTANDLYLPPFMPNMVGGWSSVVPTVNLVEAYEMNDGRTIEEAKADGDYDESNPFVNRDPRLRATVLYPGQIYDDAYKTTYSGCYNPLLQYFANGVKNDDYGTNADNASKTGLQVKKFLQNLTQFSDVNSATTHFPIFRYAEVLLTIAECDIELNQNLDEAVECINTVRNRAGMPDVNTAKYNSQSTLRELVRRERRVEFAGEGLRRADLKRWGILTSTLSGFEILRYDGDVTTTLNAEGDYNVKITGRNVVSGETYKFQEHNELLPIPLTQMEINSNLVQNPGY